MTRRVLVAVALLGLYVLWFAALDAFAIPYRLTYTAPDARFGRCAATWNGVPWVLDVQAGSFACGASRCTDAAQMQAPPADVQLACYADPNPAATVAPVALSNVVVVPVPTASPGSVPSATRTPEPAATRTATALVTATPSRTATPVRTATRTATPVSVGTATPIPACAPVASWTGAANDYWGDPMTASVVTAARQRVTVAVPFVPCGVTVRGYGEVGAAGSKAFELWREDLASRVDGGVSSAALDVASALQPRDYVLGWPATVTVPAGRYFLRASGVTTGARWRWSATTPGAGAFSSNVDRGSAFVFVLYGRTAGPVASATPATTASATRTATPSVTATRTPTSTFTAMPTATLVFPTKTATPMPTATQTPTPQPTTSIPVPDDATAIDVQTQSGAVRRFTR